MHPSKFLVGQSARYRKLVFAAVFTFGVVVLAFSVMLINAVRSDTRLPGANRPGQQQQIWPSASASSGSIASETVPMTTPMTIESAEPAESTEPADPTPRSTPSRRTIASPLPRRPSPTSAPTVKPSPSPTAAPSPTKSTQEPTATTTPSTTPPTKGPNPGHGGTPPGHAKKTP